MYCFIYNAGPVWLQLAPVSYLFMSPSRTVSVSSFSLVKIKPVSYVENMSSSLANAGDDLLLEMTFCNFFHLELFYCSLHCVRHFFNAPIPSNVNSCAVQKNAIHYYHSYQP